MYSILYASEVSHSLSEAEINHILDKARARNVQEGVTGILLHKDGHFLQYIEGPKAALARVYQTIEADNKHKNLKLIFNRPVVARLFPEWSMAYQTKDIEIYSDEDVYFSLLYPALTTNGSDGAMVKEALNQFWQS